MLKFDEFIELNELNLFKKKQQTISKVKPSKYNPEDKSRFKNLDRVLQNRPWYPQFEKLTDKYLNWDHFINDYNRKIKQNYEFDDNDGIVSNMKREEKHNQKKSKYENEIYNINSILSGYNINDNNVNPVVKLLCLMINLYTVGNYGPTPHDKPTVNTKYLDYLENLGLVFDNFDNNNEFKIFIRGKKVNNKIYDSALGFKNPSEKQCNDFFIAMTRLDVETEGDLNDTLVRGIFGMDMNESQILNEIDHLYKHLEGKEKTFIQDLFNKHVTIMEKIDGRPFQAEYTSSGWTFYKKNDNKPVNNLDKTVSGILDEPIAYFESITDSKVLKKIEGKRIVVEYVPPNRPTASAIIYDKSPLNKIILLSYGGSSETKDMEDAAKLLNISPCPIIFEGYLSDKKKADLNEYLEVPFEDLQKKYDTTSFTKIMFTILNPKLKSSFLHIDLEKLIEGIVISFNDKEQNTRQLLKIVEKDFETQAKQKGYGDEELPTVNKDLVMNNFIDWFKKQPEPEFVTWHKSPEDNTIMLVDKLFVEWYNQGGKQLLQKHKLSVETKDLFLNDPQFQLKNVNKLLDASEKIWNKDIEAKLMIKDILFYMRPARGIKKIADREAITKFWKIIGYK